MPRLRAPNGASCPAASPIARRTAAYPNSSLGFADDLFTEPKVGGGIEPEVNIAARDILIPPTDLAAFVASGDFSVSRVRRFASMVGVSPGVVVGRLQSAGLVRWSELNFLKVKYELPVGARV